MGCAASREGQGRTNRQGYWYDREENLITVNFTDSEPESEARPSELGSLWSSDFESSALDSLPKDIPEKAAKVLLDPENRIDSGIWVENISLAEYDPEDYPVFDDNDQQFRKRSQSLNMTNTGLGFSVSGNSSPKTFNRNQQSLSERGNLPPKTFNRTKHSLSSGAISSSTKTVTEQQVFDGKKQGR